MPGQVTKTKASELLRSVGVDFAAEGYLRGMGLSAHLETADPSSDYQGEPSDAFQRILRQAGIISRSMPQIGVGADTGQRFIEKAERAGASKEGAGVLLMEFCTRAYKTAQSGRPFNTRGLYTSQDQPLGSVSNPWVDSSQAYWNRQLAPQIPIAALIAMTTPIDSDSYRAFYLTDDAANQRMVRVGEGAMIPAAKLVGGEREIRLHKYGRRLKVSYETLRRLRLDQISMHIQRMAIQAEVDKLDVVLDVAINGDGNANTAATSYNLTTLDAGTTANNPTLKAWQTFKAKFLNPYMLDTVLGNEGPIVSLQLLNTGSANVPMVFMPANQFGSLTPINPQLASGQRYGITTSAPANKWVGMDTRLAIEQITEVGATIQEMARVIADQTQEMTFTETEGWRVIDQNATKIVNLAA